MYPFLRLARQRWIFRNAPPVALGDYHRTHVICWPWDLDRWLELNNGRALTLMDLARIPHLQNTGLFEAIAERGWTVAVAGASIRYRRRVRMFDRIELRSRVLGWDARFTYCEQSIWLRGECATHGLFRMAVAGPEGIVPSASVARAMGLPEQSPALPGWVTAWAEAEALRPWPPMAG